GLSLGEIPEGARGGIELELVFVPRVLYRFGALDEMETQVERVSTEDVSHAGTADDHHLEPRFLRDPLEPGGGHLARGADREAIARDQERLARFHTRAKLRHEVAEGAGLPALVQCREAFGDAVRRRRDLVGIDRVKLLPGAFGIPEDEGASADGAHRCDSIPAGGSVSAIGRPEARRGLLRRRPAPYPSAPPGGLRGSPHRLGGT